MTASLTGVRLDLSDAGTLADQAAAAEAAAVDFVLLDDPLGEPGAGTQGLDPIEAAAFVAALAPSPALVVAAAVTHAEPFHLANRLSSLDWGSSGRAGWLATIDPSVSRARAYGVPAPSAADAAREAADVVEAVRRLWDSWEDDALVADFATGRFLDADKLHYTDTERTISVHGPALMPRPIQGQIPIFGRSGDDVDADAVIGTDLPGPESLRELAQRQHPDHRTLRERLGLPRPANRFAPAGAR